MCRLTHPSNETVYLLMCRLTTVSWCVPVHAYTHTNSSSVGTLQVVASKVRDFFHIWNLDTFWVNQRVCALLHIKNILIKNFEYLCLFELTCWHPGWTCVKYLNEFSENAPYHLLKRHVCLELSSDRIVYVNATMIHPVNNQMGYLPVRQYNLTISLRSLVYCLYIPTFIYSI